MNNRIHALTLASTILLLVGASCSGEDTASPSSPTTGGLTGFEQPEPGTIGAQVAVYETVANRSQRFRLGLVGADSRLVGFGTVMMHFAYLGTESDPVAKPEESLTTKGAYLLVAGQDPQSTPADHV